VNLLNKKKALESDRVNKFLQLLDRKNAQMLSKNYTASDLLK